MTRWHSLMDRVIYAPRRRIDLQVLWPQFRERGTDLNHARALFAVHAFTDKAWLVLSEDEIDRVIAGLN